MSDTELKTSDILALDHTRLAAECTLHGLGSSSSFHDQLWVYHLQGSSGAKHVARSARYGTLPPVPQPGQHGAADEGQEQPAGPHGMPPLSHGSHEGVCQVRRFQIF